MDKQLQGKRLLVINGCNPSKAFVFKKLHELGLHVIVLHPHKAEWIIDYVDEWILTDVYDHQSSLQAVQDYISDGNIIEGVVTFWEESVLLTSKITDMLKLPGISYETASKIKNKHQFRQFCLEYGIPSVKSHAINTVSDLEIIKDKLSFPVILKPCFGAASTHTIKVNQASELENIYNQIVKNDIENSVYLKDGTQFFVEEFIEGDEIDIDILVQNGIVKFYTITDNLIGEEPYFMELGESKPTTLDINIQKEVVRIVEDTIASFGIQHCCAHYEFKLSPTGPIPLEVNLRLCGGIVYDLIYYTCNIEMIQYIAMIACCISFNINNKGNQRSYVSRYLLPPKSGIIKSITVPEHLSQDPDILYINVFKKPGDLIQIPPEGYDNFDLGNILVVGEDRDHAQQKMQQTLQAISIEIQ